MTIITPADNFDDVKNYDLTDPVKGGVTGESSVPIVELTNRTQWLRNRIGGYVDVKEVTGNANLTAADANKLISVAAGGNVTINIAALSGFKAGNKISFVAAMSGGPFWVNIDPAESIADGSTSRSNIWVYDGEMIELVAGATNWKLTIAKGNFGKIGNDDLKRIQPRNTFIADGSVYNRAQYPRLWAELNGASVTDYQWLANGLRYQSFFSLGDGINTFRSPDMRSMSLRALDLSRGISLSRLDESAGGYQADAIKAHTHPIEYILEGNDGAPTASGEVLKKSDTDHGTGSGQGGEGVNNYAVRPTGGTENTTKNIGLLPVIYY